MNILFTIFLMGIAFSCGFVFAVYWIGRRENWWEDNGRSIR